MTINIAIAGISGRMGQSLATVTKADRACHLAGGYLYPTHQDAPEFTALSSALSCKISSDHSGIAADVVLDFTTPKGSLTNLRLAKAQENNDQNRPAFIPAFIIGTTGFSPEEEAEIESLAQELLIVKSGNMSLGVNILANLTQRVAAALGEDYDIEIFEAHHKNKVDAPSGTALMLGEAAAKGRNVLLNDVADRGRDGITGARESGKIGFAVARMGGIIGDHKVSIGNDEEVISLSHRALDRQLFAKGALVAAKWAMQQRAKGISHGLFDMQDVLGLK